MTDESLHTIRLTLRPLRASDAPVLRELWLEREPRVPAHRRIDVDGKPTVEDLAADIVAAETRGSSRLLAVERRAERDVIGYCGLVNLPGGEADASTRHSENSDPADSSHTEPLTPEIAFELLRSAQGQGYAFEAASTVVEWGRTLGYTRLWATVWNWNSASRSLLAKLGFVELSHSEGGPEGAATIVAALQL